MRVREKEKGRVRGKERQGESVYLRRESRVLDEELSQIWNTHFADTRERILANH